MYVIPLNINILCYDVHVQVHCTYNMWHIMMPHKSAQIQQSTTSMFYSYSALSHTCMHDLLYDTFVATFSESCQILPCLQRIDTWPYLIYQISKIAANVEGLA